jgi:hypothetical protein
MTQSSVDHIENATPTQLADAWEQAKDDVLAHKSFLYFNALSIIKTLKLEITDLRVLLDNAEEHIAKLRALDA